MPYRGEGGAVRTMTLRGWLYVIDGIVLIALGGIGMIYSWRAAKRSTTVWPATAGVVLGGLTALLGLVVLLLMGLPPLLAPHVARVRPFAGW